MIAHSDDATVSFCFPRANDVRTKTSVAVSMSSIERGNREIFNARRGTDISTAHSVRIGASVEGRGEVALVRKDETRMKRDRREIEDSRRLEPHEHEQGDVHGAAPLPSLVRSLRFSRPSR